MQTKELQLTEKPYIHDNVELKNTQLGAFTEIGLYNFIENATLDDYSYTGQFCFIQNSKIGKFVNIAAKTRIGPTDHPYKRPSLHHFTYRKAMYGFGDRDDEQYLGERESRTTYIGHDAWIGHGAIIQPGISIGIGAIVGSGAVVTKDVPPYAIVVGVPAKVIKYRFSDSEIKALRRIGWWDWSFETIKKRIDDFQLNITEFIKLYDER
jgi:phosphonate metabolism protein (transferase hexapeptide repeat family)